MGFTSGTGTGTGTAAGNHDIVNWEFREVYSPISGAVPEPATWPMMIIGFFSIGVTARATRRRTLAAS